MNVGNKISEFELGKELGRVASALESGNKRMDHHSEEIKVLAKGAEKVYSVLKSLPCVKNGTCPMDNNIEVVVKKGQGPSLWIAIAVSVGTGVAAFAITIWKWMFGG